MGCNKIFRISYRIFSLLLFITVLFCSIFSSCEGVLASDPEINSLPVDIDIDVEYTSDIISLKYLNNTYTINRNTSIDLVGTGHFDSVDFHGSSASDCYSYPVKFEYTNKGYTKASYWFSPSDMKVFVLSSPFCTYSTVNKSLFPVCSYSDSSFSFFKGGSSRKYVIVSVIDLSDYSISLGGTYISSSDDIYKKYELFPVDSATIYNNYFPNDLVCIFSNYAISGFYDPDTSKVNTPDYYFDNQYIFYSEGNGYTFVDSASRLSSIGFPLGVNTARYTFEDTCNFYVYTSVDGITWVKKTSVTTMYSDYFDVEYASNFAITYILVYTNDSYYSEEAVIPPEYPGITDIGSVVSLYDDYYIKSRTSGYYVHDWTPIDSDLNSAALNALSSLFTHFADGDISGMFDVYLGFKDSITPDFMSSYMLNSIYMSLVTDVGYYYRFDGTHYQLQEAPSIRAFLQSIFESVYNINVRLDTYFSDLSLDLKSVFDNISNTNTYLSRILDDVRLISIPDYSDSLHNLEYNLTHVNDDISVEIAQLISGLPDYSRTLNDISSVVQGIPEQLNTLFVADKLVDAIDLDSLFDSDTFDLSTVKSFVSSGISVTAVNSFSKLLDFDSHTLSGFKFINGYITKLYNVNHTFSMVCLIGAGFTTMNYVIRKSKG